jgi:hypothetical protein
MTQRLARIVPADPDSPRVRGTKVITADGSEIRGIRKLTLVADPNDGIGRWTAHIEMNVLPPVGLSAMVETTDIASTEREFERDERLDPDTRAWLAEIERQRAELEVRMYEETMAILTEQLRAISELRRAARNNRA